MTVQEEQNISAERAQVFAYLSDVTKRTEYIPMLEELLLLDDAPIRVGSRYIEVATIAGQELRTTYQVIELQAPERIKVKTIKSVFPIEVRLSLEALGDTTLLSMELEFKLKGVYKLASPLVKGIVQQQARDILHRLKAIFEVG